ncbi:MAG: uroporphyrinogen decarboxylase family protein, partial [Armatimonadota bacterium]
DTALIETIHRYGAIAHYHNHGPVSRWLEALAGLGMDSLDPLEAPPWGDVDIANAKRRIGSRVCLLGNLDDMEVLDKADESEVRRLGRELIEKAGPGGYIVGGTASGTYGERAARNFIALADVARQMAT